MEEIDYNALTKALSSRRFLPQVFDTTAEAKAAALEIIGTKSVGIGGSATVRDITDHWMRQTEKQLRPPPWQNTSQFCNICFSTTVKLNRSALRP